MPKIKSISYERLFNLGNFNNEKIGFIAEFENNETPEQVFSFLKEKIEDAHIYSEKINSAKQMLDVLAGKEFSQQPVNSPDSIPALEAEISKTKNMLNINQDNFKINPNHSYLQGEIKILQLLLITQETELANRYEKFKEKVEQIKKFKEEYGKIN